MSVRTKTPDEHETEEAAVASTLVELLRLRAAAHPDRLLYTFLHDGEQEEANLSYSELDRRARVVAALLQRSGARGERALLLYPAGLDFIAAFFGCLYAGVVPVPTYPPHQAQPNRLPQRLRALLEDAQPSFALSNGVMMSRPDGVCARVAEVRAVQWVATDCVTEESADDWRDPGTRAGDLALLQYTSGSTSSPKGVMVSHRNLMHNQRIIHEAFGQNADSVVVGWLPLYHDMGLIGNVLQPLYAGARCILMSPVAFMQSPARWLQAISRYRATTSGGPNFAYDLCARKITPEQLAVLDLSSWSVAFNGAEPIQCDTLERFAATFAPCGFRPAAWFPCYGLAEATLFVSGGVRVGRPLTHTIRASALGQGNSQEALPVERDSRTLVTCGRPLAEQHVIIVDPASSKRSPPGRVGEIWTAGKSVAEGYWNRPAETDETFRAFLSDTGEGPFLRTGDLGFVHEGDVYVTGRLKDLIIIRGRNHYPQDIERTVEQSHRAFRPGGAAAFAFEHGGAERLVVVQELEPRQRHPDVETLAGAVRQAVAEHHELSVYDVLLLKAGSLPKTSSGKIQRHACRDGYLAGNLNALGRDTLEDGGGEACAHAEFDEATFDREHLLATPTPGRQSLLETFLLTQVAHTLGISPARLSREKPLSVQGLDSLSTLELKGSIEASLGVNIPLTNFLDGSTAADLARYVLGALADPFHLPGPIALPELPARASYPLSRGQKALWLLHQLAPASAAYVISNAVRFRTTLDEYALRRAFGELVSRHPALRTTFSAPEGVPMQHVHERADVCFTAEDASGWGDAALQSRLAEDSCRPFDLERGPLIRAHLYTRSDDDHTLLLAVDHIIADLLSVWVLVYELEVLYAEASGGASANLEQPLAQFADYVAWQEALLAGREGERLWNYWRNQLAGDLPVLNLPTDRPRPPVQSYRGASQSIALGAELMGKLKNLCRAEGVTLYTLLVAIFQVLLFRYTGQQDILVGSPASGRTRAEFDDVIGYFVNPLVLRVRPEGQTPLKTFLADVQQTVLSALDHQDFPFPLLVERLQPARDPSRSPIFQVMFVLQKVTKPELQSLNALALREAGVRVEVGELTFDTVGLEQQAAPFDLTLVVAEIEGGLSVRAEYARELFEEETIRRMLGHYAQLLGAAAHDPLQPISALPLLTPGEEHRLLVEWNSTRSDYDQTASVITLFERQVEETPEAVAVVFAEEEVSYRELNRRANRLGHYLRGCGVGPEVRVGLLVERSVEMVVALLGTLKSGGVYVPLDATHPQERLQFMAEDAGLKVLVTQKRLEQVIPSGDFKVIYIDTDWLEIEREGTAKPANWVEEQNASYLIYTSGSTGNPKAVVVEHRSLTNVLLNAKHKFNFTTLDVFPCLASFSFDISLFELVTPLLCGGTVRVLGEDEILDLNGLVRLLDEVTVLHAVPSLMGQLLAHLEERAAAGEARPRLRAVFVGGEAVPAALLERIRSAFPDATVHVLYGPTEAAIICASYAPGPGGEQPEQAIGNPLPNAQLRVQGVGGQLSPVGVSGELYVGGVGVARGYLNCAGLTAERFMPDPYSGEAGARLYRTGDLARYLPGGELEFLGRVDSQVKVRGYRIELGEIEAALLRHGEVRECVVAAREDEGGGGGKRLVAYVVGAGKPAVNSTELRNYLREQLPEYMVPAQFVTLESLPLTPNGKVDRKALPAPAQTRELGEAYQAPRTTVEEMLAGIWGEVLGLSEVGRQENFFDLGGHSLLITQVAARVRNVFDVELPVTVFFQEPTIKSLALAITQSQASRQDADTVNQLLNALEHLSEEEVEGLLEQRESVEERLPHLRAGNGNSGA